MESSLKLSALCAATVLFGAPMMEFEEVRRSKRVGERPVFPMVCMWANSLMWVVYGLHVGDIFPTVATNLLGLLFSTYYCAVYVWAAESAARRSEAYSMFVGTLLVISATCTFCFGSFASDRIMDAHTDERVAQLAGTAAASSTVLQYASPLTLLVKVVRRRSTEGLSRPLAVVSLVCGSLWLWYGVLTENLFIYVPNSLGVLFSAVQCVLFLVYPRKMKKDPKKAARKEKVSV